MDTKMFDYITASQNSEIPDAVLRRLEDEADREFPYDPMLMELHVLRAVNTYTNASTEKEAANR
jgi:hypothetical protein